MYIVNISFVSLRHFQKTANDLRFKISLIAFCFSSSYASKLLLLEYSYIPLAPLFLDPIFQRMTGSSVKVVVRLRPLNAKEEQHGTLPVLSASTEHRSITAIKTSNNKKSKTSYTFDQVFGSFSSQQEVFDATLQPILKDVLDGYESTVFAYGQTGTGKVRARIDQQVLSMFLHCFPCCNLTHTYSRLICSTS